MTKYILAYRKNIIETPEQPEIPDISGSNRCNLKLIIEYNPMDESIVPPMIDTSKIETAEYEFQPIDLELTGWNRQWRMTNDSGAILKSEYDEDWVIINPHGFRLAFGQDMTGQPLIDPWSQNALWTNHLIMGETLSMLMIITKVL